VVGRIEADSGTRVILLRVAQLVTLWGVALGIVLWLVLGGWLLFAAAVVVAVLAVPMLEVLIRREKKIA
jgi:hypothetical protein